MDNITYDDWFWGNPIPIECLTEQDVEDLKRIIDEISKLPLENMEQIKEETYEDNSI